MSMRDYVRYIMQQSDWTLKSTLDHVEEKEDIVNMLKKRTRAEKAKKKAEKAKADSKNNTIRNPVKVAKSKMLKDKKKKTSKSTNTTNPKSADSKRGKKANRQIGEGEVQNRRIKVQKKQQRCDAINGGSRETKDKINVINIDVRYCT